jgi:hypothetical protein
MSASNCTDLTLRPTTVHSNAIADLKAVLEQCPGDEAARAELQLVQVLNAD